MEDNTQLKKKKGGNLDKKSSEEPSWYHYFIILFGVFLLFFLLYFSFEYFNQTSEPSQNNNLSQRPVFYYEYIRGNITYNIEFSISTEKIKQLNYSIPFSENDLFNTNKFYFSFMEYENYENGQVSFSTIKLRRFLSSLYFFSFNQDQFVLYDNITCLNSTPTNRVMVFDINSNTTQIITDENGCLYFSAQNSSALLELVDSFMYKMITDYK